MLLSAKNILACKYTLLQSIILLVRSMAWCLLLIFKSTHIHKHTPTRTYNISISNIHVCIHIHICIYLSIYMHTRVHMCTYLCTNLCMYVHTCTYTVAVNSIQGPRWHCRLTIRRLLSLSIPLFRHLFSIYTSFQFLIFVFISIDLVRRHCHVLAAAYDLYLFRFPDLFPLLRPLFRHLHYMA